MAVGNLEAIRDWIETNWYNFEQMNDILVCGAVHLYNKDSIYYCDEKKEINWISTIHFYKTTATPCYQGSWMTNSGWGSPILISKEPEGVQYSYTAHSQTVEYEGTFVVNGITWYYSKNTGISNSSGSNYIGNYPDIETAAKALLQKSGHLDLDLL